MRLHIHLDVSDGAVNLAIEYIPEHPSRTDKPGVLAIYEPLHTLPHICLGKGPPYTGYESIQPLGLCGREDDDVLLPSHLRQVGIDLHILVANEKRMPATILAGYQCSIELDGYIVFMSCLSWLFHAVPGTYDERKDRRNQTLLEEVVPVSGVA